MKSSLVVVELVVAELVEASKHRNDHRKKLTKPDGLTSTSSATTTGSAIRNCQYLKIDFRVCPCWILYFLPKFTHNRRIAAYTPAKKFVSADVLCFL